MASKPPYLNLVLNHNTSGNQTLVAAQAGKRILVHDVFFVCTAAVVVRFDSAAGGTAITGAMSYAANGGIALPFNEKGWFETLPGELLNLNLGGAVVVAGSLKYSVVN